MCNTPTRITSTSHFEFPEGATHTSNPGTRRGPSEPKRPPLFGSPPGALHPPRPTRTRRLPKTTLDLARRPRRARAAPACASSTACRRYRAPPCTTPCTKAAITPIPTRVEQSISFHLCTTLPRGQSPRLYLTLAVRTDMRLSACGSKACVHRGWIYPTSPLNLPSSREVHQSTNVCHPVSLRAAPRPCLGQIRVLMSS